jgi:formylglycine-generating enzyme required for sulfatase activity
MMSEAEEYFKELKEIEREQGNARLQTIVVQFFDVLERLPKLKQEVDRMMQSSSVANGDELAGTLERQLDKAAELLALYDMLPEALRKASELEGFFPGMQSSMTMRTIDVWAREFAGKRQEAEAGVKEREKMEAARQTQETEGEKIKAEQELANKLIDLFEFVPFPGGSFLMGDYTDNAQKDEKPVHEVQLDSFYMGKYPVTQGQWQMVMGSNPSHFKLGETHPVENVSWHDVQEFLSRLNQLTGKSFRLPTEAEWEYAARSGGKQEIFAGTRDEQQFEEFGWFSDNSENHTHAVGLKKPNGLELYDMCGNVREWCSDWYDADYYHHSALSNPQGAPFGSQRVNRGGSWAEPLPKILLRAALRSSCPPDEAGGNLGFRLLLNRSEFDSKKMEEVEWVKLREEQAFIRNFLESIEFVHVPGGNYQMGEVRSGYSSEKKVSIEGHEVHLDSFFMGKYPVTQRQWQMVMGYNPSCFKFNEKHPIESVSWYEVQAFLAILNLRTKKGYRLPTEAEWEYAARSGGKHVINKSIDEEEYVDPRAWYADNSQGQTHAVGMKKPNGLGFYDMLGNVWEWCSDYYDHLYNPNSPTKNPQGPPSGKEHVQRGGSWNGTIFHIGKTDRNTFTGNDAANDVGFRLVLPSSASGK